MKDTDLEGLRILYRGAPMVRESLETDPAGYKMLGRGIFEKDLEECGYTKKELRKLCDQGILKKTTTVFRGAWRNTYVLLQSEEGAKSA